MIALISLPKRFQRTFKKSSLSGLVFELVKRFNRDTASENIHNSNNNNISDNINLTLFSTYFRREHP